VNNKWWTGAKIASVLFNSISTFNVFDEALSQSVRPMWFLPKGWVVAIGVFLAIAVVDLAFLAFLMFLEAPYRDNENFEARWAYVVGLIMLYMSILLIGVKDEGFILAVATRVGVGIIALAAILRFWGDWRAWKDFMWEDTHRKKRERMRKDEEYLLLEHRSKKRVEASTAAINNLFDDWVRTQEDRFRRDYLDDHTPILVEHTPKLIESGANGHGDIDVYVNDQGEYEWQSPYTGEVFNRTAKGDPYTEQGAKRAAAYHQRQHE